MRNRHLTFSLSLLALALGGCQSGPNFGGPPASFLSATVQVPTAVTAGQPATWTANITGGIAPYTVVWDFGGGADPATLTQANVAGPTAQATATPVNPPSASTTYFARVTVVDSIGAPFQTPAPGVAYTIVPRENHPPVVASAVFSAATYQLTLTATDPDPGDILTVTLTPPAGVNLDALTKSGPSPLTVAFDAGSNDLFAGASGTLQISVSDGHTTVDVPGGVAVTIPAIGPPGADALFAIPLVSHAAVGEAVTVVVATIAPANPFQYMNGVGLTVDSDADLVWPSLNYGVPGGAAQAPDGCWTLMAPSGFTLLPDDFPQPTDIGGGRERWDFNITPVGGSDLAAASGALFNVQFKFSTPGTKSFGFQATDVGGIKRTYYSGSAGTEYFWGNISNDTSSAPHSVVIE